MKIVAIMQNQWFKKPDVVAQIFARHPEAGFREKFIARTLFMGCKTGKMLMRYLGEDLCNQIIWEEASRQIGGQSDSVFPPDIPHLQDCLDRHQPDALIAFGSIAKEGITNLRNKPNQVFCCCHPTARGIDVASQLTALKHTLQTDDWL